MDLYSSTKRTTEHHTIMSKIYDSQKVLEIFDDILTELKDKYPEIDIEPLQKEAKEQIEEHFKYIKFGDGERQRIRYFSAGMILATDERKSWWHYNIIQELTAYPEIQKILKNHYGKNYTELIKRLLQFKEKINKIKYYLDMKDKTNIHSKEWWIYDKLYLEAADKIELIDYELYDALNTITQNSDAGVYSIPDSIINTMQKEIKKPEYTNERREEIQERRGI